jgi:hypothetical protein
LPHRGFATVIDLARLDKALSGYAPRGCMIRNTGDPALPEREEHAVSRWVDGNGMARIAGMFGEHEFGVGSTYTGLVGAIWTAHESFAVDLGLRAARIEDERAWEILLGFTWAIPVWSTAPKTSGRMGGSDDSAGRDRISYSQRFRNCLLAQRRKGERAAHFERRLENLGRAAATGTTVRATRGGNNRAGGSESKESQVISIHVSLCPKATQRSRRAPPLKRV